MTENTLKLACGALVLFLGFSLWSSCSSPDQYDVKSEVGKKWAG